MPLLIVIAPQIKKQNIRMTCHDSVDNLSGRDRHPVPVKKIAGDHDGADIFLLRVIHHSRKGAEQLVSPLRCFLSVQICGQGRVQMKIRTMDDFHK